MIVGIASGPGPEAVVGSAMFVLMWCANAST